MNVKPSFGDTIVDAEGGEHPAIRFDTDDGVYHARIEDAILIGMLEQEDHEQYNAIMVIVQGLLDALAFEHGMDA